MLIDTHLHYYEFYSADLFLRSLASNLAGIASEPGVNAGVILDRSGYRGFELLAEAVVSGVDADVSVEGGVVRYRSDAGSVDVYRGVQVACAEGFEVLGLFCGSLIDDGVSAGSAIANIKAAGGIPVIAWAPGKWLFSRRGRVKKVLKEAGTVDVCIGDSALRPDVWGEPDVMLDFRVRGGKVLCGSDPLPYPGQECVAGTYATVIESNDAAGGAVDAMKRMMVSRNKPEPAGRRTRLGEFVVRMIRVRLPE